MPPSPGRSATGSPTPRRRSCMCTFTIIRVSGGWTCTCRSGSGTIDIAPVLEVARAAGATMVFELTSEADVISSLDYLRARGLLAGRRRRCAAVTAESVDRSDPVRERARFLSRIDPFRRTGARGAAAPRGVGRRTLRGQRGGGARRVRRSRHRALRRQGGDPRARPQRGADRRDQCWRGVRPPDASDRSPARVHDARSRGLDALLHPHGRRPRDPQPAGGGEIRRPDASRAPHTRGQHRCRPCPTFARGRSPRFSRARLSSAAPMSPSARRPPG